VRQRAADFQILICGKKPGKDSAQQIEKYAKRLTRYGGLAVETAKSEAGNSLKARKTEGGRLIEKMDRGGFWFVCDEKGRQLTSVGLANKVRQQLEASRRPIGFVVGSAYGLDKAVIERADFVFSLSQLTLPHEMVPMILAEQIYRAVSIIKGLPYHHE
jgi:23S rRNA (pseudouridine1915-N3)-methyltransferase